MIWQDKGFLLAKNKYSENSSIVDFFTKNNGKVTGVIYGSTSKKIKNYLLIGNKFHLNFSHKNEGRLGYFKIEIDNIHTPFYLENQKKLLCISYVMNLIKILTVDNQENILIYNLIDELFVIIKNEDWLVSFIFWELKFYKIIGYDVDFSNYVKKFIENGKSKYIVESNQKIIPNFMINGSFDNISNQDIIAGIKIVGDFLEKTILRPNNLNLPLSRNHFLNSIKK